MPSLNSITPILPDSYYHIFNRGNNYETLFYNPSNYIFFLKLYQKKISKYCDTLAYCLLPNHFHFLLKTKENISLPTNTKDYDGCLQPQKELASMPDSGLIISEQFRRLFITYTMSINNQENRVGSLFSKPFKRLLVDDENYLKYLVWYIHNNPIKHGYFDNYKSYTFSSYQALISNSKTHLNRELLFEIFGGIKAFVDFHCYNHEENELYQTEP